MSFAAFGIKHLSPSTLNGFAAQPAMFVMQKVLGRTQPVGAAAHRGTCVEEGIVHGLMNRKSSLRDCCEIAISKFQTLTALSSDPRIDKEAGAIILMIEEGLKALLPMGGLISTQGEVRIEVPGLEVPLFGYYDMLFESGALVDLKTTHALPSKISVPHARQVALYSKGVSAGDKPIDPMIAYVTPKKSATYRLENADEHFNALVKIALTVQKLVNISDDPMEIASLVTPDVDSFYWNDPLARQAAFEVWGV